jgi:hypothetical protein
MAKPLYVGVFLTPEARALLLLRIAPIHPEVHADHMTIKFKPTDLELENLVLGKAVRLKVTSSVHDEKGQAVNVHGVFSANKHSHITISVDRDKGGTPNYSNELRAQERAGTSPGNVCLRSRLHQGRSEAVRRSDGHQPDRPGPPGEVFNPKTFKFDEVHAGRVASSRTSSFRRASTQCSPTRRRRRTPARWCTRIEGQQHAVTPELAIGLKENIPGPSASRCSRDRWRRSAAVTTCGSNEYLRIKIYNDDKAKENWAKASSRLPPRTRTGNARSTAAPGHVTWRRHRRMTWPSASSTTSSAPRSRSTSRRPASRSCRTETRTGKAEFVRQAETLEQLEYSMLVDEDGNKEYPRGPPSCSRATRRSSSSSRPRRATASSAPSR